jgi:hypothetical protein
MPTRPLKKKIDVAFLSFLRRVGKIASIRELLPPTPRGFQIFQLYLNTVLLVIVALQESFLPDTIQIIFEGFPMLKCHMKMAFGLRIPS